MSVTRPLRLAARKMFAPVTQAWEQLRLHPAARRAVRYETNHKQCDPGIERSVREAVGWLCRAQDCSRTADGGVARHFSLIDGWGSSYPETTGYIVPTMLEVAGLWGDESLRGCEKMGTGTSPPTRFVGPTGNGSEPVPIFSQSLRERARRMCDWLCAIQLPGGGFQGGMVDATPVVPVTFNTGQILLGLAAAVSEFGEVYRQPMRRAADWLVETQDADGCWRKHPTPFAKPGEKAYETHVAWGLLEAARVETDSTRQTRYADAALRNVRWALSCQRDNGWFDKCCLDDATRPLTHTLGYVLRGLMEAHRFSQDLAILSAARKTADGLLSALRPDGFLPGRLRPNWRGAVRWVCLTGSVQIAHSWLMLYQITGEPAYRDAAQAANRYVRTTVDMDGPPETRGGVKGSFPVHGGYGTYQYLNWACKFFIDAQLLEHEVCGTK